MGQHGSPFVRFRNITGRIGVFNGAAERAGCTILQTKSFVCKGTDAIEQADLGLKITDLSFGSLFPAGTS